MNNDKQLQDLMGFIFPNKVPYAPEMNSPLEPMVPNLPKAPVEDYDAMLEQDQLDKQLQAQDQPQVALPDVANQPAPKPQAINSVSKPMQAPQMAPAPQQEDFRTKLLEQFKQAREANKQSVQDAQSKDADVALLNALNKSFNQMGTGIANRAGYTKIASNPLEVASELAKQAEMSGAKDLEGLKQDYGIMADREGSELQKQKMKADSEDRAFDRNIKLQQLALEKQKLSQDKAAKDLEKMQAKEEFKEDIAVRKENRKIRKDLEGAVPALEAQLQNIKEAKQALKKASTGPIDQYIGRYTKEGQTLENKLNKISLDTMVKMFSGMSKAVDTDAERAMFQSTQPSMGRYEDVNEDMLNKLESSVQSMINKSKKAISQYDRKGNFTEEETQQSEMSQQPSTGPYGDTVERNGKMYKWNPATGKYNPLQ